MKKIILVILCVFVYFNPVLIYGQTFTLSPLSISYNGAVAKDSTIIFYGDYGTYKISKDNGNNWEFVKIFEKGIIAKIFWEENILTAFTRDGNIKKSEDNGETWLELPKINLIEDDEWLEYFIKIDDKFLCRSLNNLYLIDSDLNLEKVIENKIKYRRFERDLFKYGAFPITFHKNKIFSIIDTNIISIFDKNCNFINNVNIKEAFNLNETFSNFYIFTHENNIILNYNTKFYKTDDNFKNYIILDSSNSYYDYQIYNNELYLNTNGKVYLLKENGLNLINYSNYEHFFDATYLGSSYYRFIIHKDIIYFYGEKNVLYKKQLLDSISFSTRISDNNIFEKNSYLLKHIPSKNKILVFSKDNNYYNISFGDIQKNQDKITDYVKRGVKGQNQLYLNKIFQIFYYDEIDDKIILCSNKGMDDSYFFVSDNFGQNFKSSVVKNDFEKFQTIINFEDILDGTMGRIENDYYITTVFRSAFTSKFYTRILLVNIDLEQIFGVQFENQQFLQSKIADSLNYDILSIDKSTNKLFYKSTTDKGENWEVYKEYPITTNLLESKELEINGKKIWAYTYYDFVTSQFNLDIIDVENRKVYNVFQSQLSQDHIDSIDYISFDAAKEKFYLSFYNTLMVSSNIFEDNIKWETFNYPNNGRVNKKFQIFDKTIFARYEDDKNEDNVYWINGIEMVGDPTGVEHTENIEEMNYLYTMPPYPNPTRSDVTAKFYWDSSIDIDNSEIAVYDLNGNKVSGKENLTLEKLNELSGNIKWNSTGQPSGTYLIKIQHGNNTKSVKVVVN